VTPRGYTTFVYGETCRRRVSNSKTSDCGLLDSKEMLSYDHKWDPRKSHLVPHEACRHLILAPLAAIYGELFALMSEVQMLKKKRTIEIEREESSHV